MHQGSCLCESVRYEIDGDLKPIVNCHCKYCRKAHSSEFVALLLTPADNLRITTGEELLKKYHVENVNADRCFCSKCGTRLYNNLSDKGMVSVATATLEEDKKVAAVAHVNTESKSTWFTIEDKLPQFLTVPSPIEFGELLSK